MASRDDVLALIHSTYAAFKAGEVDDVADHFSHDVSFRLAGAPEVSAVIGEAQGQSELSVGLAGLADLFEVVDQEVVDSVIEGDKAAVHWRATLRHRASGTTRETEFCEFWTLRDGKAVSFVQFLDTALLNQMSAG